MVLRVSVPTQQCMAPMLLLIVMMIAIPVFATKVTPDLTAVLSEVLIRAKPFNHETNRAIMGTLILK